MHSCSSPHVKLCPPRSTSASLVLERLGVHTAPDSCEVQNMHTVLLSVRVMNQINHDTNCRLDRPGPNKTRRLAGMSTSYSADQICRCARPLRSAGHPRLRLRLRLRACHAVRLALRLRASPPQGHPRAALPSPTRRSVRPTTWTTSRRSQRSWMQKRKRKRTPRLIRRQQRRQRWS